MVMFMMKLSNTTEEKQDNETDQELTGWYRHEKKHNQKIA